MAAKSKITEKLIIRSIPGKQCIIYNPFNSILNEDTRVHSFCQKIASYRVSFYFRTNYVMSKMKKISMWDYEICEDHLEYVLRVYPTWFYGNRTLLRITVEAL